MSNKTYYQSAVRNVPDSVKTPVNDVLNKKFGTSTTYPPTGWPSRVNLLGKLPIRTASGAVASFSDGADDVPLKSLTAQIVPIQEGTGDPSPTNPRPISGTSVLNVEQRGKNFVDVAGRTITSQTTVLSGVDFKKGTYIASADVKNNGTIRGNIRVVKTGTSTVLAEISCFEGDDTRKSSSSFTLSEDTKLSILCNGASAGYSFSFDKLQIEVGSTATAYEPYNGSTYPIALGRTVYGGSAEVVEGTGDSTMIKVKIKDLDWSKHAGTGSFYCAVSDKVVGLGKLYCEVFNPVTGNRSTQTIQNDPEFSIGQNTSNANFYLKANTYATKEALIESVGDYYICYELATPTPFTFTGQEITSLLGVNNIWHDGNGTTEVEYRADIDLLLTSLQGG